MLGICLERAEELDLSVQDLDLVHIQSAPFCFRETLD